MHAFAGKQRRGGGEAERVGAAVFGDGGIAVGQVFRRITDEHGLAERVDVNRQTHRCHRLRDHQIPETAGYVPVKFVAVFIVPQFAVEHIVKFVGINARLQFKLFLGRDQVAVAGVFQPVGNFGAVDAHAVKIRDGRVFDPVAGNGIFRQRF